MSIKENPQGPLIWIDLEMTGLNVNSDSILEIATVVTNDQLEVIAHGPSITIGHKVEVLDRMNEWCLKHHKKSGLFQESAESNISTSQAEEATLNFLRPLVNPGQGILCGNSVWQDRLFLQHYMPKIYSLLHYKIIDVSSIKEVVRRWYPKNPAIEFKKSDMHRARADIIESIEELKHYRLHFFK